MSLRFDTRKEYEERTNQGSTAALGRAVGTDTEIALGTRSLLAIFFGLVLICSIFFGLGYSMGRAGGSRAAAQPAPANPAPASNTQKPSADQTLTPVTTPAPTDSGTPAPSNPPALEPATAQNQPPAGPASPGSSQPAPAASAQSPANVPAAARATLQPAAATIAANFMVQVAAVRVPQDAQILVDALKKHGYAAVVRNEPQDQLLHIQLGPYASRADAMAMRAKLLGDGYNAVVK